MLRWLAYLLVGGGLLFGGWQLLTSRMTMRPARSDQNAWIFVTQAIGYPLTAFHQQMGRFPTSVEGLGILFDPPVGEAGKWQGPYVDRLPRDPWGNLYRYRFPSEKSARPYDVWSLGPDGRESDDDIGNWMTEPPASPK